MTAPLTTSNQDRGRLSADELALLASIGVTVPTESEAATLAAQQRQRLETHLAALHAAALSAEAFADAAGLDTDTVDARIASGALWVLYDGGEARIPSWALHDGAPLPGLGDLSANIPTGMHPVAVDRWVHTPNPDLTIGDTAVSVIAWLRAGLPVRTAVTAMGDPVAHT